VRAVRESGWRSILAMRTPINCCFSGEIVTVPAGYLGQVLLFQRELQVGCATFPAALGAENLSTDLAGKEYRPDFAIAYMFEQQPLMPDMNG